MRLSRDKMTSPSPSAYEFVAQAETLLIYGIFLFLTGLAQIGVTLSHRHILQQATKTSNSFSIAHFLPTSFTNADLHLWYIYPSAAMTLVPCLCCVIYAIFKRQWMAIFICMSSFISFVSSSIYVGLLIIHTLEYWQSVSSHRFKTLLPASTTTTSMMRLLVPFDEPATFTNLALLITFTLALVQALLSLIGAVMSCLWSPCCFSTVENYTPVSTHTHYSQTTSHRYETPPSATIRSMKRSHQAHHHHHHHHHPMETHRFLPSNDSQEPVLNGFLHKTSPIRSNYDEV